MLSLCLSVSTTLATTYWQDPIYVGGLRGGRAWRQLLLPLLVDLESRLMGVGLECGRALLTLKRRYATVYVYYLPCFMVHDDDAC